MIFITGITGRVGSELVKHLNRDEDIVGLTVPGDPRLDGFREQHPAIRVREVDLRDGDEVAAALPHRTDHIVHLGALMVVGANGPRELYEVNTLGTMVLLEAAISQPTVPHFTLASTDGTYDVARPGHTVFDEDATQLPGDPYSVSKVLAETLVRNYHRQYDLAYNILRFSTVVTSAEARNRYRRDWIKRILDQVERGPLSNLWRVVRTNGLRERLAAAIGDSGELNPAIALVGPDGSSWGGPVGHASDIGRGVALAVDRPNPTNTAINVAGMYVSHSEGAAIIADQCAIPHLTLEMPLQWSYDDNRMRAEELIGYAPHLSFRKMIATSQRNS